MNRHLAYGLATLMLIGTCMIGTGCRGTSTSRTSFRGDRNVTVVKKKPPKIKGRSKPIRR